MGQESILHRGLHPSLQKEQRSHPLPTQHVTVPARALWPDATVPVRNPSPASSPPVSDSVGTPNPHHHGAVAASIDGKCESDRPRPLEPDSTAPPWQRLRGERVRYLALCPTAHGMSSMGCLHALMWWC
jgi:hypothetical protein